MRSDDALTSEFEAERPRLRQIAFRMLGSLDDADDALQQAWLRASAADRTGVVNLPGWLTTVTSRVCLDLLRTRRRRAERPLTADGAPSALAAVASPATARAVAGQDARELGDAGRVGATAEAEAILAESVGLALLVVLDRLTPAQRVAFVLHDLFSVPFEDVARAVDRSTVATKKLASRARERVRGASPRATPDRARSREVVEAFLAASREGDLPSLMELLAPGVVRRADAFAVPSGTASVVRGAGPVAEETKVFAGRARTAEVALVDGAPGIVVAPAGRLLAVLRVVVDEGRITEFEVVGDPARLATIPLRVMPPPTSAP